MIFFNYADVVAGKSIICKLSLVGGTQIVNNSFFLIASLIGTISSGYITYLAWLKPEDFAEKFKGTSIFPEVKSFEDWTDSSYHLWLARILAPFFTILCGFVFLMSVYGFII